jgi:hypothetical protein
MTINRCSQCAHVRKDSKYYYWCSLKGEDRRVRDNNQVNPLQCACTCFERR